MMNNKNSQYAIKNSNKHVKAVLFDLGETILNFGKFNRLGMFSKGARVSYDFLVSLNQNIESYQYYYWRNLFSLIYNRLSSRITQKDSNSLSLLRWVGTNRGYKLDSEQWKQFAWKWYEPLRQLSTTESDIKHTLTLLKNSGLQLGIVSNTFVNGDSLDRHLEMLDILNFFEVRIYSYKFSFRKPDRRLFKIAAERIGRQMHNILYVGDRIDNDIIPALKNGMYAVLKTAYSNKGKIIPDGAMRISCLAELPGLIEKINAEASFVQNK